MVFAMMTATEAWNALLFWLRSTRAGLAGMVAFTLLITRVHAVLRDADRRSAMILLPYVPWLGHDPVYAYELWRRNHTAALLRRKQPD
jgi:tryptophan-rich sensory protein